MKLLLSALAIAAWFQIAVACGDDHAHSHVHARSTGAGSVPITPPSRPLVWSDFNVIHTTDSHGWLLGHQKSSAPEPNYSGDFGDFASFVTHMKDLARVCLMPVLFDFHEIFNRLFYAILAAKESGPPSCRLR